MSRHTQYKDIGLKSIISNEYDGKTRQLFAMECELCHKEFYVPIHVLKKRKYCSRSCQNQARSILCNEDIICSWCGNTFKSVLSKSKVVRHGYRFCCRKCKDEAQRIGGIDEIKPPHYGTGFSEYRNRAIRTLGGKCNKCGYSLYTEMLDVHHIDGNRKNGSIENLEVICVWCHALATRGILPHCLPGAII